jgi:hypothetical protein
MSIMEPMMDKILLKQRENVHHVADDGQNLAQAMDKCP